MESAKGVEWYGTGPNWPGENPGNNYYLGVLSNRVVPLGENPGNILEI